MAGTASSTAIGSTSVLRDAHEQWPSSNRTVLAEGGITAYVQETVTTPSGDTMTREFVTHPGAVAIVAWDEDLDAILTLRQYRHPVKMILTELPAGLLDVANEDYVEAAQRELAEEAGLAAHTWNVLLDLLTTPGSCDEALRIYLARTLHEVPPPDGFVLENEEAHMTRQFVPRAELVDAIMNGWCESPSLVSGVLALETARLSGQLGTLRPADAPWLARPTR